MSSLDGVKGGGGAKPTGRASRDNKREFPVYKYSYKGKGPLYEAVIVNGNPVFLKYEDDEVILVHKIEEDNRVIRPPYSEEYPYEPYEFVNTEEIQNLVQQAKSISINTLYLVAREIVEEYNEQDHNKIVLIATDIVYSYFQDKFATTHYVSIVGDNDSGKSSLGITFEAIGY